MNREKTSPADGAWRTERRTGMLAIAAAMLVAVVLWFGIRFYTPIPSDMDSLGGRMAYALKCAAVAVLFTLVMGVEAVAHERLRSPAFDPLQGYETRRMQVNQRYLQNTLEQTVIFLVGLPGLALYMEGAREMRAVLATSVVWTVGRLAFWAGYHRSAAMRGLGAPSMLLGQLVLIYVAMRVGEDIAGRAGWWAVLGAVLLFEALLFLWTRPPRPKAAL
jgi:hypothetical protein